MDQLTNDLPVVPHFGKRVFLGWDRPVLESTVARLWEDYGRDKLWDMRNLYLVLPSALAKRRLGELLVLKAQQESVALYAPAIVTIGMLPETLYVAKRPFASELVQALAWMTVLKNTPVNEIQRIIPHPPDSTASQQWLELGKVLSNLHQELASDRLVFADVIHALGRNHIEADRWRRLVQLQQQYLSQLHQLGLWDIQTARLEALKRSEAVAVGSIIVVGCVDLNRTQRAFLQAVSDHVQVWIAAPPDHSNHFDPWGCLESEVWQSVTANIPSESLLVGNAPADQAELVAATLAELGDAYHTRQVTLGVPEPELIPELQHHLDLCGITARFGPGKPLSFCEPARLLALVGRYIESQTYSDFAALVRHPAIDSLLRTQKVKLPDDWLSQLDKYYQEALPKVIDGFVNEALPPADVYRSVTSAINRWLSKLGRRWLPVSQWVQPLLGVLMTAYDKVPCNLGDEAESQLYQASSQLCELIVSLRDIPVDVEPKMTVTELIDWLLRNASQQLLAEPPSQTAVEMLGWLELALDDAPALVVAGMHDGVVPESVSADAFLPNQLRRQLGMMDNARRYARDMYSLQVMLASRQFFRVIVGKSDAAGDPLVPSRLLLACPLAELPARVLHLVQEDHADVLPAVARRWKPTYGGSKLVVPQPQQVKPPSTITVTAFRDYLRCPYRYYLRHILKLRDNQDADIELDAPKFGVLVHGALDKFGRSSVSRSTDAQEIGDYLVAELLAIAAAQFGPNPPASVLIQIEQAQARLEAFAVKQAQRAAEGWEIRFTEQGSSLETGLRIGKNAELTLIGRIDRIDFHPATGQWAIWDYKTSESAKHPAAVHWNQRDQWLDLQLPLYVPIARTLGVSGNPLIGYIGLPKLTREIDFYIAEFDEAKINEALAVADEVASKVAACEFWPERIEPVDYDDYARICQTDVQRVQVSPPARKLYRTEVYARQLVPDAIVQSAKQRLNNHLVRAAIQLPPLLIRASAGTGKTFQLSNRLLHILLSGQDVDPILATTFTRKAAGEIMQRVLQRLALGCIDESKRVELAQHLPGVDVSAAACLATLRRVTASIHRLRISTLDSFFAQIARTFSLDMGLPPGWSSMDPIQEPQAQMQAIAELLDNHERKTLIDLVRMLAKGESTRKVSDEIRNTVSHGYALYRSTTAEAWDQLPLPKPPSESAVESAVMALANTRMNHKNIDPELEKLQLLASTGDWEKLIQHGIYNRLKEDPPTYYRKELPRAVVIALETLADRAAAELMPIRRAQTIASYDVLKAYDACYSNLIRRQRSLAFADVSFFLSQWMLGGKLTGTGAQSLSQLEYRMDCGIQHLLLDEFQDTSLEQWDILRPLAKPLGGPASSDRSFFCVGDTKQAIYGWRGGVAEIFDSVTKSIDGLETSDLRESYRSSPEIMQVVNQVFENLHKHDNYSDCNALAHRWSDLFPQHRTSRRDLPGYVQLVNGPKLVADDLSADEKRLIFLTYSADRIAELTRTTSASIGVLFRTNADVARMISLLRDRGVSASQGGGNPLTDSAAVELILSLVHLADHPGDGTSAFHVQSSPLALAIPAEIRKQTSAISAWFRQQVSRHGLGKTIEKMADQVANQLSWWDQQRLQQLIRSAHAFESTGGRLREFEEAVERDRVTLPTESQVKVMTIHGSKGLEFDAVFLPELDSDLTKSTTALVTRREDPCEPPTGVLRYMNAALQTMLPDSWQRAFAASKASSLFEMLCVLYVAMTRARCALYMITHPSGKSTRQDYSSLLHSTLVTDALTKARITAAEAELLSLGNPQWYEKTAQQRLPGDPADQGASANGESLREVRLRQELQSAPVRGMRILGQGTVGGSSVPAIASELDLRAGRAIDVAQPPDVVALSEAFSISRCLESAHEKLIHALFGQIDWLETFHADHERMRRLAFSRLLPEELRHVALDNILDQFLAMLNLSSVKAMLSRSRYQREVMGRIADNVEVISQRLVHMLVDGALVEGTIDRIVVLYQDGQPFAAELFDIKVDAFDPQMTLLWLEDRVDYHRPQLELYAGAVAQQLQISRGQVASHLLMLSTDDMVCIDSTAVPVPESHVVWSSNPRISSGR